MDRLYGQIKLLLASKGWVIPQQFSLKIASSDTEKSAYPSADMGRATKGAARAYLAGTYTYQLGTINSLGITWDDVHESGIQ